jgi:hypothetical protein
MAERIVLLTRGEGPRAREIIDSFAQRSGLEPRDVDGGVEFPLSGDEHAVPVVQTLTEIDPGWTDHLALGDP